MCITPPPRPASSAWCAASPSNWRATGIRVNGMAPGYIRTAQLLSEEHSLGPAGAEAAAEFIPMGRIGEPEDIADVIVFLGFLRRPLSHGSDAGGRRRPSGGPVLRRSFREELNTMSQ